jgi:hypothetical protein
VKGLDLDVEFMDRQQLKNEIKKLRGGIRLHRDCSGHNLCWWHPELWGLLPEYSASPVQVPPVDEFLDRCRQYRESLQI